MRRIDRDALALLEDPASRAFAAPDELDRRMKPVALDIADGLACVAFMARSPSRGWMLEARTLVCVPDGGWEGVVGFGGWWCEPGKAVVPQLVLAGGLDLGEGTKAEPYCAATSWIGDAPPGALIIATFEPSGLEVEITAQATGVFVVCARQPCRDVSIRVVAARETPR